jgi:hypothetical protein
MKNKSMLIVIMLCAGLQSGIILSSQSWYDWGTSGIKSGLSSGYQTVKNLIPSSIGVPDWATSFVSKLSENKVKAILGAIVALVGVKTVSDYVSDYVRKQTIRKKQLLMIDQKIKDTCNSLVEQLVIEKKREIKEEEFYDIVKKNLKSFQSIIVKEKNIELKKEFMVYMNNLLKESHQIVIDKTNNRTPMIQFELDDKGNLVIKHVEMSS